MVRDYPALTRYLASPPAFAWGPADCARFANGAAIVAIGRDVLADLGLDWDDEDSAKALLVRLGGLEATMDKALVSIAPARAHRGDIAGVRSVAGDLLLLVVDGEILIGPLADGRHALPRRAMVRAWSIEPAIVAP